MHCKKELLLVILQLIETSKLNCSQKVLLLQLLCIVTSSKVALI